MKVSHLKVDHKETPLGYQFVSPVFSFIVEDTDAEEIDQARLIIAMDPDFLNMIYDSGHVKNVNPAAWKVSGIHFEPMTRYFWKVSVIGNNGEQAESLSSWFETSKEDSWTAQFISPGFHEDVNPVLFREFIITKPVSKARIYITGLGLYEVWFNHNKCGDEYLAPGFCDYSSAIPFQTYETEILQGTNLIEILLGNGWYKGKYGITKSKNIYGSDFSCIAEIHVWYQDGSKEIIPTDLSWKSKKGQILSDGIYDGETYNASFSADEIYGVIEGKLSKSLLAPRINIPITADHWRKPVAIIQTPAGETVLDMGQIMTGWLQFQDPFERGKRLYFQFGEVLQDGNFYRDNLRSAKAEFIYISDGAHRMVRPHFTYYGFRYVKITGWDKEIRAEDFTGLVLHSKMEQTGHIKTSNPMVNQLFSNALWGQKCNFLDIPTDCPQRNGRMGWTGDAQMISGTAMYNFDCCAFFQKYCHDIAAEQKKTGGEVPHVVPLASHEWRGASAAWGDAAVIIPWNLYLHYGDASILEVQYSSMKSWVEYIRHEDISHGDSRLWNSGQHFGDWLSMDTNVKGGRLGKTDPYYIASIYYYYSASILAKTANILDKSEDAAFYKKLSGEIKSAIQNEYFTGGGKLCEDTMTAHALALYFQIVPKGAENRIKNRLNELLRNNSYQLNTGFVGTPYLCPALSECGCNDLAYRLLLNPSCPGWLYEVKMGATTIWERWDSILPDGKVNGTGMNSLNHHAYGTIVEWIYAYVLGIKPSEEIPGFRRALITPYPDKMLRWVKGAVRTAAGTYTIEWNVEGNHVCLSLEVPCSCRAEISLKNVCGEVLCQKNGISMTAGIDSKDGTIVFEVPAGKYDIFYTMNDMISDPLKEPLKMVTANKEAMKIIEKYIGPLSKILWKRFIHCKIYYIFLLPICRKTGLRKCGIVL